MAQRRKYTTPSKTCNVDRDKLKKAIDESKYTSAQLSEIIGYGKSYISGALTGNIKLSERALDAICTILDLKKDAYIVKEIVIPPAPESKKDPKVEVSNTSQQSVCGITPSQFNSLLAVLQELSDNVAKIAASQNNHADASKTIADNVAAISDALGVTKSHLQPKSPSGAYVKPISR